MKMKQLKKLATLIPYFTVDPNVSCSTYAVASAAGEELPEPSFIPLNKTSSRKLISSTFSKDSRFMGNV
jgi:hypothetical protein